VRFDIIIVGGGPAGAACARFATRGGARVAILDRATFPRVKLCAGWLSVPIWDELEIAPSEYDRSLWEWNTCHVHYGGTHHKVRSRGFFIRRYEFDEFLLRGCGAEVFEGYSVKDIERDGDDWVINGEHRARYLVGAGGTHCPVARTLFRDKPRRPVGVQEREFQTDAGSIAASRIGGDGEPELLLYDDLRGYAWNVPKTEWLNVGCGTVNARDVRSAWDDARGFFQGTGHIPEQDWPTLDRMKGHSYYLFDPAHLDDCQRSDGAFIVGDALGLAQPFTAEGILPAVASGRLCAEAILDGDPAAYASAMRSHPVMADYTLLYRIREAGSALKLRVPSGRGPRIAPPRVVGDLSRKAVANAFAWMFSGKRVPAGRAIGRIVERIAR
jgi:flavin-dependent dehydrogenase